MRCEPCRLRVVPERLRALVRACGARVRVLVPFLSVRAYWYVRRGTVWMCVIVHVHTGIYCACFVACVCVCVFVCVFVCVCACV